MKKKIVFIFAIICITVFLIFYYIFLRSGNNKFRNQNELLEDIFEKLESYEANVDVTIKSNKNENLYNMIQIVDEDYSKVILNSPENVKGLTLEIKDGNLIISNESANFIKEFKNYKSVVNNSLFLSSFIKDFENNESTIYEENGEILIEILLENENTYKKIKVLYLDKEKKLPKKLIIKDNTQNINTSIIYNDIKIK
ncbi:MAG: hypothetical protein IJW20_07515 [Clostridia bacterium]|nr:hypothetical protein [Clostridia bacterium]